MLQQILDTRSVLIKAIALADVAFCVNLRCICFQVRNHAEMESKPPAFLSRCQWASEFSGHTTPEKHSVSRATRIIRAVLIFLSIADSRLVLANCDQAGNQLSYHHSIMSWHSECSLRRSA